MLRIGMALRPSSAKKGRGPSGCPECGGLLLYDPDTKSYTCRSCGRVYTREELTEARRRVVEEMRTMLSQQPEGEGKEQMAKEYLRWYLSSKEEK